VVDLACRHSDERRPLDILASNSGVMMGRSRRRSTRTGVPAFWANTVVGIEIAA
jgi:hypothetical protein